MKIRRLSFPMASVLLFGSLLDDGAAKAITAGVAPFAGSFHPQNSLSAFDGQNVQGYRRLPSPTEAQERPGPCSPGH